MAEVQELAETISAAVKAVVALTKQLSNVVGIIEKNIESYWKLKDAASRRKAADDLMELSRQFGHAAFLQGLMSYERTAPEDEVVTLVASRLEDYSNLVDQIITNVEKMFPELVHSEDTSKALKAALDKKKLVKELREFLQSSSNKKGSVSGELADLDFKLTGLQMQSLELGRVIKAHADAVSRPPARGKKTAG